MIDPHSDYEEPFIAAAIADPTLLDRVELTGADFTDEELGSLYDRLRNSHLAGLPLSDPATIARLLQGSPIDTARLLLDSPFEARHGEYYADKVREASRLRRLVAVAKIAIEKARDKDATAERVQEWLLAQLAGIGVATRDRGVTLAEAIRELADDAENAEAGSIPLGIAQIDGFCGHWRPGELVIVGARTGVGKSIFHLQTAREQARQGLRILFASVEMSRLELASRTVVGMTDIRSTWLRERTISAGQVAKIRELAEELSGLAVTLWDPPTTTIRQLTAYARCLKEEKGLHVVHVDYLQRLAPDGRTEDRRVAVDAMAQGLKTLARELGVLVVASCQLSRKGEDEPTLAHLRESGAIEQEADAVILLSRAKDDERAVTADVAKNRHGASGEIALRFNSRTLMFEGDDVTTMANYAEEFSDFSG